MAVVIWAMTTTLPHLRLIYFLVIHGCQNWNSCSSGLDRYLPIILVFHEFILDFIHPATQRNKRIILNSQ